MALVLGGILGILFAVFVSIPACNKMEDKLRANYSQCEIKCDPNMVEYAKNDYCVCSEKRKVTK